MFYIGLLAYGQYVFMNSPTPLSVYLTRSDQQRITRSYLQKRKQCMPFLLGGFTTDMHHFKIMWLFNPYKYGFIISIHYW